MSSCDRYDLEYFVEDSFRNITPEQEEKIVELLEPEREWIEWNMVEDYDEEHMSWRGYRNSMWDTLDEYEKQIKTIVGE